MQITILGDGVWGRALHSVIQQNTANTTQILGRGEKADKVELLVLSVPTQSIREALGQISFNEQKIIVNTAKGIESSTHALPHEIVQEELGKEFDYYTLSGPSFAKEVTLGMPTLVNLGYRVSSSNNQVVQKIFQTPQFHVRLTPGVEVLELSGAFKNIYAIGCGLATGLGFGDNTRAALIVMAIEEMHVVSQALGLTIEDTAKAATIGDIVLCCNSVESRNFRFGTLLAAYDIEHCFSEIKSTIEGFNTLASLSHFEAKSDRELPFARFISGVVQANNPQTIKKSFEEFFITRSV